MENESFGGEPAVAGGGRVARSECAGFSLTGASGAAKLPESLSPATRP